MKYQEEEKSKVRNLQFKISLETSWELFLVDP